MRITTRVTGFKIHDCNVCELQEGETVALIKEGERIAVYHDYLGLNRFRIGFVPDDYTTPQIDAMMNRTDSRVAAVICDIFDCGIVAIDVYTVIHSLDRTVLIEALKELARESRIPIRFSPGATLQHDIPDSYWNGYRSGIEDAIDIIESSE